MKPEHLEQLRRFVELREQFERNVTLHPPKRPGFESFIEIARDLPVPELLEELEHLQAFCRKVIAARDEGIASPFELADDAETLLK